MKAVVALIGVGLLMLMLGAIMLGIGSFRGAEFQEPHNIGSGNTSANIVLANEVLDDTTTSIEVLSSEAADAPVPYLYVPGTRTLTVNGLDNTKTRTLTITYLVPRLDSFTDVAAKYLPAFLVIAGIAIVGGAAYSAVRR